MKSVIDRTVTICHLFWQSQVPDTNGDGIGDVEGVIRILPLLKEMGFGAVWLAPFLERGDEGYDIKDYFKPANDWGSLDQTRKMMQIADELDIAMLCDFVPPHTSDENPMFVEAMLDPNSSYRDWYYFVAGSPDRPPTETCSVFGDRPGSAWTWRQGARNRDDSMGMWTFNLFASCHPALNFHNGEVVAFMSKAITFWAEFGFRGARIDSARHVALHPDVTTRSEPLAWPQRSYPWDRWDHTLTSNVIDTTTGVNLSAHVLGEILSEVRRNYPNFYAVGENVSLSRAEQHPYALSGLDVLDYGLSASDTGIGFVGRDADQIRAALDALYHGARQGVNFVPFNANHDAFPFAVTDPSWVGDPQNPDPRAVRAILTLVLTCPSGGPAILYGPPLGTGLVADNGNDFLGRAAYRGVLRWDDTENGGFSGAGVTSYWPMTPNTTNVVAQLDDSHSLLAVACGLMHLRREVGVAPTFALLGEVPNVVCYQIGQYRVTLNVGSATSRVPTEMMLGDTSETYCCDVYCCDGIDAVVSGQLPPLSIVVCGPDVAGLGLVSPS